MKRVPDPELLLRRFYADELRAAAPSLYPGKSGARFRAQSPAQSPLRSILAAAAALAIIAGSAIAGPAMAERPAGLEARGIPIIAAAFAEQADAVGLLEPFKAWAEELKEKGGS
jgi:hypothetical protein